MQYKYAYDVPGLLYRIALACFLVFPLALYIRLNHCKGGLAGIKEVFLLLKLTFFTKMLAFIVFFVYFCSNKSLSR